MAGWTFLCLHSFLTVDRSVPRVGGTQSTDQPVLDGKSHKLLPYWKPTNLMLCVTQPPENALGTLKKANPTVIYKNIFAQEPKNTGK